MKWCMIDDYDVANFKGYNLSSLILDQYYLNINVSYYKNIFLYTLNKDCYECPYLITDYCIDLNEECSKDLTKNIFNTHMTFRLATERKEYFPQDQTENVICDINNEFGQFGVYNVEVNESGCFVDVLKQPVNIYTPILTVTLIWIVVLLMIFGATKIWKKLISKEESTEETHDGVNKRKQRILSLDTFRGLTVVIMIFVNYGQGGYTTIEHARWNGLHVADLVFPSFLWIMGACIPIGMISNFKKSISNKKITLNILKRSIKLFCLGIFLNGGSDLNYLRILGVLQRLGICYFVTSIICLYLMNREDEVKEEQNWLRHIKDLTKLYRGWLAVIGILILHTVLIFSISAPNCPRGYMGPGGLHKNRSYVNCIGGATGYIDGLILGNHRYQYPTIYDTYEAKPFDPEGLVGCLTSIFQTFIGVQAGITLIIYKSHSERLIRWLSWAVITGMFGGILSGFSKENGIIPVNKNLWSLSFVMATSCFSFFMLSICYVLVDSKKWWHGKPFIYAGQNAILLYIGHELLDGHFPVRWYIHNSSNLTEEPRRTHFLALLSDTWATGFWILITYYLYKIKYFFTI
ncbi:heparan-alpha-glucosaminide N-acetyltransferase [Diorhabda carinulata]|uniref:heparan-alpha-glucosaminide N-acetyltransferase n=1 Tax=Diorhabda carinulata TaxID=1163345 RepID=UPI0025A12961|nr:heparan-alpha-glucosaminide N-acetyltransferase [Diorhabda carinulata]XP_057660057.1 heparan-alpha-glucosaminide N-acetyltransferase [Diorhabda carinulata]XP_057660058.1 heparan-alpha-glucosaminide N-acetyltransferase [Diorhabda carinulata]XP_057660060.1 heparan-alpha-glucosaminide N-acetyltransferase [Diorhabda carinulata]XP_057660061.1 heparan-alpha-glucosaminide N-acetyltransferase [Diorhabda carinulata]XP_057660062.1 heparan-alpha-glucosaminide N-acetyltransferase [Diorhabda carinulata]